MHHDRARGTGAVELFRLSEDSRGGRAVIHGEAEPREKVRGGLRAEVEVTRPLPRSLIDRSGRQPFPKPLIAVSRGHHEGTQERDIAIDLERHAADDWSSPGGHECVSEVISKTVERQAGFSKKPLDLPEGLPDGRSGFGLLSRHRSIVIEL